MSGSKRDKPTAYKKELNDAIEQLKQEIQRRRAVLMTDSPDFFEKMTYINSLRQTLQAKLDRLAYLNRPAPYMPETHNRDVINKYINR